VGNISNPTTQIEPSVILYQINDLANLSLWDGNFAPIFLFGTDKFPQLADIGFAAWKLISGGLEQVTSQPRQMYFLITSTVYSPSNYAMTNPVNHPSFFSPSSHSHRRIR